MHCDVMPSLSSGVSKHFKHEEKRVIYMSLMNYIFELPSPFCKLMLPFLILKHLNFMRRLEVRMSSEWLKNPRGLKVIDAGCAGGLYSLEYAHRSAFLIGIDISKESVKIEKSFGKKLGLENIAIFFVRDITKIPIKNESFDVVICNCVLELPFDLFNRKFIKLWAQNCSSKIIADSITIRGV